MGATTADKPELARGSRGAVPLPRLPSPGLVAGGLPSSTHVITWHNFSEQGPAWLLAALLCLVFFTGGSSWISEPQLMVLRPAALVLAALGVLTFRLEHLTGYWVVWALFLGALGLTVLHLVPMPFEWWSKLPGRGIIVEIDEVVGLGKIWRPLSMSPDSTLHALLALSVPFAVLLLAVQLTDRQQQYMLGLVLGLAGLSGAVGLLQASGSQIEFYPLSTPVSGLFANRNHQGALLAMIIPMAAAASLLTFGGKVNLMVRTFLALGMAIIAVPLIIVTGSRSALVVLALGLVFAGLIWSWRKGGEAAGWKLRLATPLAIAATTGGLVWLTVFAARDVALDRLQASGEDLRWPVWKSIVDMLPAYMPWGTGIGSYAEAYQILEPDELLRPTKSNHAHNELLEVVFTAGVPGLVIFLLAGAALVYGLWRAYSRKSSGSEAAVLSRLGTAMIVLLAVASATDYPVRTPIMSAILVLAAVWASLGGSKASPKPLDQG